MDTIDRKLLYALDINSSLSYAELARVTRLPQELVRYRTLRLEREGIIQQTAGEIDFHLLGYLSFQILFRLQSVSEAKIKIIGKEFTKRPFVSWVARVEGKYQLEVVLRVVDPSALHNFLEAVNSSFGDVIAKRTLMVNVEQTHLSRDYLRNRKKRSPSEVRIPSTFGTLSLDETDRSILRVLQQSARFGRKETATKLIEDSKGKISYTPEGVANRLRALENRGVVRGYLLAIDNKRLQQQVYRVLFAFRQQSAEQQKRFLSCCRSEPRCVFYLRTLGEWDLELEFEVSSSGELREILARLTEVAGAEIKDYSILEQLEIYKFNMVF